MILILILLKSMHTYLFDFLKYYSLNSFLSLDIILSTGNNFLNIENDRVS